MSTLTYQLETLYYYALLQNAKTAPFKKRSYDVIERIWQRIKDSPDPTHTEEWTKLSKSQKEKLNEYMTTGTIEMAEVANRDTDVKSLRFLLGIYGIGIAKARKLLEKQITSIELLKKHPELLTKAQKLGVEWYGDLKQRIPRKEIDALHVWLSNKKHVPNSLTWRIVGSYRRGAQTSGDVDILVTGEGRQLLIKSMKESNIIRHTLANGKKKFMGMGVLPGGSVMRHIDIIETTVKEFPFTSLYFTGSADWNVKMRHKANEFGYRLNEHNYTYIKTGKEVSEQDYRKKLGKAYPVTEQDVCDMIDWEWKVPSERF